MGKTIIVIALLACVNAICDKETLSLRPRAADSNIPKRATLIRETVDSIRVDKEARINFMKVERTFEYCNPKIVREIEPKCRVNKEAILFGQESIKKGFNEKKCPIGTTCSEHNCRGSSSSVCLNPTQTSFSEPKEAPNIARSPSLLYYSCTQYWSCRIEMGVISTLYLNPNLSVKIENPHFGEFVFVTGEQQDLSIGNNEAVAQLADKVVFYREKLTLSCFTEESVMKGHKMCYDPATRNFFSMDDVKVTCIAEVCYFPEEHSVETIMDNNVFADSLANELDLVKLYRTVQFQAMLTQYDRQLLSERLKQVEDIVFILISTISENEPSLISTILGRSVKNVKSRGDSISFMACRADMESESVFRRGSLKDKSFRNICSRQKENTSFNLFCDLGEKYVEIEEPHFKVDSLTYSDVIREHDVDLTPESGGGEIHNDETYFSLFHTMFEWIKLIGSLFGFTSLMRLLCNMRPFPMDR